MKNFQRCHWQKLFPKISLFFNLTKVTTFKVCHFVILLQLLANSLFSNFYDLESLLVDLCFVVRPTTPLFDYFLLLCFFEISDCNLLISDLYFSIFSFEESKCFLISSFCFSIFFAFNECIRLVLYFKLDSVVPIFCSFSTSSSFAPSHSLLNCLFASYHF